MLFPYHQESPQKFYKVTELHEGCLIGVNAIRGKAGLKDSIWKWDKGAVCPFTARAETRMTCSIFTIDVFERLFGDIAEVLSGRERYVSGPGASVAGGPKASGDPKSRIEELTLDSSQFRMISIIGSGM